MSHCTVLMSELKEKYGRSKVSLPRVGTVQWTNLETYLGCLEGVHRDGR